jgi:hypothetical protein
MEKEKQVEVPRCALCGEITDSIFNINFKMVFICDSCADAVTLQNMQELIHKRREGFGVI